MIDVVTVCMHRGLTAEYLSSTCKYPNIFYSNDHRLTAFFLILGRGLSSLPSTSSITWLLLHGAMFLLGISSQSSIASTPMER